MPVWDVQARAIRSVNLSTVETVTLDPVGEAWTFGKLAYADGHIYARSQKDLFKLAIDVE